MDFDEETGIILFSSQRLGKGLRDLMKEFPGSNDEAIEFVHSQSMLLYAGMGIDNDEVLKDKISKWEEVARCSLTEPTSKIRSTIDNFALLLSICFSHNPKDAFAFMDLAKNLASPHPDFTE